MESGIIRGAWLFPSKKKNREEKKKGKRENGLSRCYDTFGVAGVVSFRNVFENPVEDTEQKINRAVGNNIRNTWILDRWNSSHNNIRIWNLRYIIPRDTYIAQCIIKYCRI